MRLLSILFLSVLSFSVSAQQNHFIYLQTENKQAFYVKLENKVFSSSATGYLILSKLTDGNYKIMLGFPKNLFPEQVFNCVVDNKDLGFLVKNFGDKGWGLFNLQSSEVIMAGDVIIKKASAVRENSSDPFSNMLANVVHDSTINRKEEVIEEPKIANEANKQSTEPLKNAEQPTLADQNIVPATTNDTAYTSSIKRTSKKKNKDGYQFVYVDQYNNQADTISIFLPVEKVEKKKAVKDTATIVSATDQSVKDTANIVSATDQSVKDTTKIVSATDQSQNISKVEEKNADQVVPNVPATQQEVKTDQAYNDSTTSKPHQQTPKEEVSKDQPKFIELKESALEKPGTVPVSKSGMINSDCKSTASDDDFLKLRKKMAAENNEDDMIRVAKKTFKTKCFSTEQVKNLSALFLKDDGKYSFLETAYPFVSDSDIFQSLESQLSDSYYINRFKAMIHH